VHAGLGTGEPETFQGLENLDEDFPGLGKKSAEFSKAWKK
jgi:hypothetical protein